MNFSNDETLTDLLRLFESDIRKMKEEIIYFDIPPFTEALSSEKGPSDWESVANKLKYISQDWKKDLAYLMELDLKRMKDKLL